MTKENTEKQPTSLFDFIKIIDNKYIIDLNSPEEKKYIESTGYNLSSNFQSSIFHLLYHTYEQSTNAIDNTTQDQQRSRYFQDTRLCYECGNVGHIESNCLKKKIKACILCASTDHIKSECPQVMCTKCNLSGHIYKFCKEQVDKRYRFGICQYCPNRHTNMECTLHWRNYNIQGEKQSEIKHACSSCQSNTHFIDDCKVRRSRSSIFCNDFKFFVRRSKKMTKY